MYPDSENTSQQTSNQNLPFIPYKMLNITETHYNGLFSEDQMSAWLTERCTKYVQHTALHVHSMKPWNTDCPLYHVQIQYFWKPGCCIVCGYFVKRGFSIDYTRTPWLDPQSRVVNVLSYMYQLLQSNWQKHALSSQGYTIFIQLIRVVTLNVIPLSNNQYTTMKQ